MGLLDTLIFGYKTIQTGLTALIQRNTLAFVGSGVSVQDDPANNRTLVSITAGGLAVNGTGLVQVVSSVIQPNAYIGTADQLLSVVHTGGSLQFFTPVSTSDVTYAFQSFTVQGIQQVPVANTAPTSLQVLQYVSGTGKWTPSTLLGNPILQLVTKTANYTIDAGGGTDGEIWCNTSGGAFNITISASFLTSGRGIWLVDSTGSFATHPVTILQHASETINGINGSKTLNSAWGVYRMSTDGTNVIVKGF